MLIRAAEGLLLLRWQPLKSGIMTFNRLKMEREILEHNDPRDIEIRKNQNILHSIGTGIIIMSAWSVLKGLSLMLIDPSRLSEGVQGLTSAEGVTLSEHTAVILMVCMTIAIANIDLLIRLYVGSSAIAVSKGRKRGIAYVAWSCLLIMISILTLCLMCAALYQDFSSMEDSGVSISSVIIELTSLVMLIEMLVVSFRLKRSYGREGRDAA